MVVFQCVEVAAIFFGGAGACAGWFRRALFTGRRHVFVEGLRFGGRAAAGAEGKDFDDADFVSLRECQNIARRDRVGRFVNFDTVEPHMPAADLFG